MLGVIGIHVGSVYILNPQSNLHLTALFEIFTRFSVPIFFFISAFGLFYNLDLSAPFSYGKFLRRRFQAVLVPYVVWSLFYVTHDTLTQGNAFPSLGDLASLLFFGNAKYQLYFLVILIWFYLLMPLWIAIVRRIGGKGLALLFLGQVALNMFIDSATFFLYVDGMADDYWLKPFLVYRLNYWVLPYAFVFILGGWLSVHHDRFQNFMQRKGLTIQLAFATTLAALLGYYYYLIEIDGYSQLEAIFTAHQLSPPGIFYTVAASVFFFRLFTYGRFAPLTHELLSMLGHHSYFVYLVHPVFITYLTYLLSEQGIIITAPLAIAFYLTVLCLSLATAAIARRLGEKIPLINLATIGAKPKR
ncbi:MAG: acyltransferase [Selenomonadaceae bacterium]|nr:acyltransferase [Selenomonadaceae bacterium]